MKIDAPYGGALRIGLVAGGVWVPDRNAYEKFVRFSSSTKNESKINSSRNACYYETDRFVIRTNSFCDTNLTWKKTETLRNNVWMETI